MLQHLVASLSANTLARSSHQSANRRLPLLAIEPGTASHRLVGRGDDSERLSATPQHDGVGLKTLGNVGNCCIAEAPLFGSEIAVPVAPGPTVAPGSVGDTDSKPTPVQGRPLSEFLPGFGWIKVFGSAGGTLSSDCACKSVLCPLSTGLVVFWASAAVAISRMMAPSPISPMRCATIIFNLPTPVLRLIK
jgi:hypothetical protein